MVVHSALELDSSHIAAPARELARRRSGTDEIALLWHPEVDRVEVSVRDVSTGTALHIDVAPGNALDAFTHPYAYVAADDVVAPVRG